MTETGDVAKKTKDTVSDSQINEIADALEKRAVAKKLPAFAKLLKPEQVDAMLEAELATKEDIRAASDEDLIKVKGIGLATVQALRDWSVEDLEKGNAIARRFLVLRCGDESLDVRPGDIIPAKFGAKEQVERGKASWQ